MLNRSALSHARLWASSREHSRLDGFRHYAAYDTSRRLSHKVVSLSGREIRSSSTSRVRSDIRRRALGVSEDSTQLRGGAWGCAPPGGTLSRESRVFSTQRKATARCSGGSLLGLGLDPAGHAVFGNIWRENRTPQWRSGVIRA
eukprot:1185652-Prorocentrum_minimum.AAC.2